MSFAKWLILLTMITGMAESAWARNSRPSSGRFLEYGHWLTCWGGSDERLRTDPPFHKDSPEEQVAAYIPKFNGQYNFEVKDTWEEWVTHSGESCSHCGETCRKVKSGKEETEVCSCNSCSWQELETFYRPWSVQTVTWSVQWIQNQDYRQRRRDWIAAGKPAVSRSASDLSNLLKFDPERPLEYYLFPGEAEEVDVSNGAGILGSSEYITPSVGISRARHNYSGGIAVTSTSSGQCDDRDFSVQATVRTGDRIVTTSPNSIEFRAGWLQGDVSNGDQIKDEAAAFQLTDISALRYEGQNILDNYKNNHVRVTLWQADRFWWMADTRVSKKFNIDENLSVLRWNDENPNDTTPPVATYDLTSADMLRTRWTGAQFHMQPNATYELCTQMLRENNVYYDSTTFFGMIKKWSDYNCAMFVYEGADMRSGSRKTRDFLSKLLGFGLL